MQAFVFRFHSHTCTLVRSRASKAGARRGVSSAGRIAGRRGRSRWGRSGWSDCVWTDARPASARPSCWVWPASERRFDDVGDKRTTIWWRRRQANDDLMTSATSEWRLMTSATSEWKFDDVSDERVAIWWRRRLVNDDRWRRRDEADS